MVTAMRKPRRWFAWFPRQETTYMWHERSVKPDGRGGMKALHSLPLSLSLCLCVNLLHDTVVTMTSGRKVNIMSIVAISAVDNEETLLGDETMLEAKGHGKATLLISGTQKW